MSYELSCIVRWMAVGCVFGYDGSGCTSALGGRAECERMDAGQLVRRTGAMNFLQRLADMQTQTRARPGWCILGSCYGAPLVGVGVTRGADAKSGRSHTAAGQANAACNNDGLRYNTVRRGSGMIV